MRPRLWSVERLVLGGTAALGVILAHGVAFLIAAPNPHLREDLLAATGHGSWAVAIAAGVGLFAAALGGLIWDGLRRSGDEGVGDPFRRFAVRLALLQVVAFGALEAAERLAAHGSLAELGSAPVVAIGVITQVLVALVGAALVAMLSRVVAALASVIRRSAVRAARTLTATSTSDSVWAPAHVALGGLTLRGPPTSG